MSQKSALGLPADLVMYTLVSAFERAQTRYVTVTGADQYLATCVVSSVLKPNHHINKAYLTRYSQFFLYDHGQVNAKSL